MSMNKYKRWLYSLLVVILIVVILAVYIRAGSEKADDSLSETVSAVPQQMPQQSMKSTQKEALEPSGEPRRQVSTDTSDEIDEKPSDVSEQAWGLISSAHEKLKGKTVPILFYGKVVDQDNEPVAGASVKVKVIYYGGFSLTKLLSMEGNYKERELKLITDAEGRFKVDGVEGESLRIWVSKEDYSGPERESLYDYDPAEKNLLHRPDPANPELFTLWKSGAGVDLLTSEVRLFIKNDDPQRVYTVNLLEKQIYPGVSDQGDMVVEAYNEGRGWDETKKRPIRKRYDWSISLKLLGGGMFQMDDQYPYRAPAAGYQEALIFQASKSDPSWKSAFNGMSYYFVDKQGRYGSLRLDVDAGAEGVIVRFEEVAVNPTGSRNLQPKDKGSSLAPRVLERMKQEAGQR